MLSIDTYADIIKVTILGSGTPRVSFNRFSQSILIEHKQDKYLFDAGRGALIRLYQSNILPNEIKNIFFTLLTLGSYIRIFRHTYDGMGLS